MKPPQPKHRAGPKRERTSFIVRLDPKVVTLLDQAAEDRGLSRNQVVEGCLGGVMAIAGAGGIDLAELVGRVQGVIARLGGVLPTLPDSVQLDAAELSTLVQSLDAVAQAALKWRRS